MNIRRNIRGGITHINGYPLVPAWVDGGGIFVLHHKCNHAGQPWYVVAVPVGGDGFRIETMAEDWITWPIMTVSGGMLGPQHLLDNCSPSEGAATYTHHHRRSGHWSGQETVRVTWSNIEVAKFEAKTAEYFLTRFEEVV